MLGLTRSKYMVMVCSGAGLSVGELAVGDVVGDGIGDPVGSEVVGEEVGPTLVGDMVTANLLQLSVAGAPQRPRISLRMVA